MVTALAFQERSFWRILHTAVRVSRRAFRPGAVRFTELRGHTHLYTHKLHSPHTTQSPRRLRGRESRHTTVVCAKRITRRVPGALGLGRMDHGASRAALQRHAGTHHMLCRSPPARARRRAAAARWRPCCFRGSHTGSQACSMHHRSPELSHSVPCGTAHPRRRPHAPDVPPRSVSPLVTHRTLRTRTVSQV